MATFDVTVADALAARHQFPILDPETRIWGFRSPDEVALLSATVLPSYVVRVTLSGVLDWTPETFNPINWSVLRFAPFLPNSVELPKLGIALVDDAIEFTFGLQTIGQNYRILADGAPGVVNGSYVEFVGAADRPSIVGITLQEYSTRTRIARWRVTFSRTMLSTGLSTIGNYVLTALDGGAPGRITAVSFNGTYADVTARGLSPGRRYRLTMASA